jgi:hypothetical protein
MNHQDIIAKKIDFLGGHSSQDISQEMQSIVEADKALAAELNFIESVWTDETIDSQAHPTANLDARFYQMLSQAQSFQTQSIQTQSAQEATAEPKGFFGLLKQIFSVQPVAQFALLAMLFMGGWIAKDFNQPSNVNLTAKLENQIDSLNVMVALSMLQNNSTTERLAGVSYAKQSGINDKKITQILFNILHSDNSDAVRLAAIDVLSMQAQEVSVQNKLLDSLNNSQSSMVQASIARVLLNRHQQFNQKELLEIFNSKKLDKEVIRYLKQQEQIRNKNDLMI